MLNIPELQEYLQTHTRKTQFRFDALEVYNVPTTGNDLERYLAGEPEPDMDRKGRWLDKLRDEQARGLYRYKVWAVPTPLIDRTRFACEWGYAYNVKAGEDVRILDLGKKPWPEGLLRHDFYLLDDEQVVRMHYDDEGHFVGAEVLADEVLPKYREARDIAWAAAEPFEPWWAARPQEHRANRAS